MAELTALHRTDPVAHVFVGHRAIDVRESVRTFPQRIHAANVVMNVCNIHNVNAVDSAAIPREKAIARPAGQPPNTSEAAAESEAQSKSPASSAKSEEGNIRRRPDRVVSAIDRSGPPAPVSAVNKPAPIVIRRPAPRLVRNPSPAIVGFIHPSAIAVWRPTGGFRWKPHAAVVGNIRPLPVAIQILRARIVGVRVLPALGALDGAVAVAIPPVPIVSA